MGDVVTLERKPEYLFSIAVYKQSDGTMRAELTDAAKRWIEGTPDPRTGLLDAVALTELGLDAMKRESALIGAEPAP